MNKYLIDTNIFIESAYRFYAFDICPGFWDFLDKCSQLDSIKSINKVYDEITSDNTNLQDFKEKLKNRGFFLPIGSITPSSYTKISQTLQTMQYTQQAVTDFSSGADYFLVALAYQESYTIVTHEAKSSNNAKNTIKIPNVCERLEINCIDIAEFLRREQARFILEHTTQQKS
ncbi:DUF4411 family protein [Campylobacter sp. MIT 21-1685]|uniref:DUF4411 family protein n=1 Tax=unclassified Campylobacter TaxID=2593542 RepID=UPI00224AAA81|nr:MULTISPECIES: DUF4411 family protein [unclassified Campylobacter]MCX2683761.1 DUF4411 family protein [Campylobacter sp. MIT 21-1684]MCX2752045.1 DUF4411 family protein [Campylobacter sp. MIT 21-1682]MCX2808229.1 DUF4411 family protein [Campylobacter sp. MIT 21-1685]